MPQLTIQQAFDLAVQHHQAGRLHEAEQLYRWILIQQPEHTGAVHNLGVIALHVGRSDDAAELFRRVIALSPGDADVHGNLGNALRHKGQLNEAIAVYREALALNPNLAEIHANLGKALKDTGQTDQAIATYRRAIALKPELPEAHNNLGNVLRDKGQLDEAIAAFRQAISLNPNLAETHYNLGNTLNDKGQLDEAIAAYGEAIALKADHIDVHLNLGNALKAKGRLHDAIAAYRRAIALNPNYAVAHYNLSLALLAKGDFQPGWEEHEWRWRWKDFSSPSRNFVQPQWDGRALEGRTILLHAEQGYGDAIQFVRYLPLVAQRGGKVIIECLPELHRLFRTAGNCQVAATDQPLPDFDFHCPLLSLPRVFGTKLADVPNIVPYLSPDPALVNAWSQRLGASDGQMRVGLAWAGNPRFKFDRTRSLNLNRLAPFAIVRGVQFYSLQKGPAGRQVANPPTGLNLIDLGPELKDFADTAAVMSLMHLIITTDTSVPHLAGALARPVWVMLQSVPHFCWLLEREDSPWYPSMRLFRQPGRGDWDGVIARVADELCLLRGGG